MRERLGRTGRADDRVEAAQVVLDECFWGDYRLDAGEICRRLSAGDARFARFLFSKIIDNSSHPSRDLKRLFDLAQARTFLDDALPRATPRRARRLRLVLHNLFGVGRIEDLSWRR